MIHGRTRSLEGSGEPGDPGPGGGETGDPDGGGVGPPVTSPIDPPETCAMTYRVILGGSIPHDPADLPPGSYELSFNGTVWELLLPSSFLLLRLYPVDPVGGTEWEVEIYNTAYSLTEALFRVTTTRICPVLGDYPYWAHDPFFGDWTAVTVEVA